ncbi:hypothetical protein H6F96_00495 [Microcoleus sp. FACHB-53]|nr:hypothetical protein [Microcoleus sp. FACHB-53]
MRDINQKTSDTDKQIAIAKRCCEAQIAHSAVPNAIAKERSVWLSYLKTFGAISTGGLSIFAVAAFLGIKPAQANITDQAANITNQTAEEEQASLTNSPESELDAQAKLSQGQPEPAGLAPTQRLEALAQPSVAQQDTITSRARIPAFTSKSLTQATEYNFAPSAIETGNFSSLQPQASTEEAVNTVPIANSLSFAKDGTTTQNPNSPANVSSDKPATVLPGFVPPATELSETPNAVEPQVPQLEAQTEPPTTIVPGVRAAATAFSPTLDGVEYKVLEKSAQGMQPTTILPTFALLDAPAPLPSALEPRVPQSVAEGNQPTTILPSVALRDVDAPLNSVEPRVPQSVVEGNQPTMLAQAIDTRATAATSEPYSGPGAARLLGDNIQAQSSIDAAQEAQSENALRTNNPLAPSLVFQGGFITQGETGARARLTGLNPVSPNLLFGGTVDLTTGEGFSDTAGTGLDITELYVTASLPSYPNLRFTAGILDLTSYFDRNSFAKDSLTHFFNPVFQTNPALARTGIGSRPAALLNWDIADNLNARAAAFSSSRSLGELAVDGFAGELAYRFDNGIIRATYASDRDDQRNGFEEIYGLARGNGELGPRTSDRETSYGINAEYYIPEIKMGLFGRYGHYQNTSMGRGGDTYSAGFNFLDLFMKDDRLGFGYGRDLSSSSLRRANKAKLPDVWEVFYDFRLTSYLRAGVTLQARDEFSDLVAGFRVKTEFDLLNLGRAFK